MALTPPNRGEPYQYALALTFKTMNKEVEYEAIITGLPLARGIGVDNFRVKCESQLVINEVKGEYQAKGERIKQYLAEARVLVEGIKIFEIEAITRELSQEADALSKYSFGESLCQEVHCVETGTPSTIEKDELADEVMTWLTPINAFLEDGKLRGTEVDAIKIRRVTPN